MLLLSRKERVALNCIRPARFDLGFNLGLKEFKPGTDPFIISDTRLGYVSQNGKLGTEYTEYFIVFFL